MVRNLQTLNNKGEKNIIKIKVLKTGKAKQIQIIVKCFLNEIIMSFSIKIHFLINLVGALGSHVHTGAQGHVSLTPFTGLCLQRG